MYMYEYETHTSEQKVRVGHSFKSLRIIDRPLVCILNMSCMIFWSAIFEKCMENGQ